MILALKSGNVLLKINSEYLLLIYQEKVIKLQMNNPEFGMMPHNGNLILNILKVLLRNLANKILTFLLQE